MNNKALFIIVLSSLRAQDAFSSDFFNQSYKKNNSLVTDRSKEIKEMFQQIIDKNKDDELDLAILNELLSVFNREKADKLPHVNSSFSDINLVDNISAYSEGHFNEQSHGTKVTGYDQAQETKRILVSGARGQAENKDKIHEMKISSLGLSEVIERYRNGITAAFVSMNSMEEVYIDCKVHEDSDTSDINEIGEWEIAKSRGKKYLMNDKNTALGVTKFIRVLIGTDYVRVIHTDLTAGACVKSGKVVSKSSIKIKQQVSYICGKQYCLKENIGYFSSENETDVASSKSNHKGYLKVQKDNGYLNKYTNAYATVDKDKMEGNSLYDEQEDKP